MLRRIAGFAALAVLLAPVFSLAADFPLNEKNTTVKFLGTKVNGKHEGGFKSVTGTASVKEMAQAWGTGDVAAVEKMALEGLKSVPELYARLLVERNNNWMPQVETCLKQNAGCFIVVGAAHLVGPDGLPAMLAKKGYKVAQQ